MAKKRTVFVDVVVDDKGTTKKLAIDSKRLSDGLEKGQKNTKDFDRNLRGVIGTSQAGGRNFAALAQGITNGIVPAYAAFAAQVFAIGAAFRFLQSAGDLSTLQKGQEAYASATGIGLRTLTGRIQEATNNQIAFTEAAQAAAIGTAAGLSGDQLERLGGAAKDVSLLLGRDVTDSFNRLVRGVTKAEPELLDELGIVLRLKDATEEYARALGKNANDLTTFERSQAVTNNVLGQAEEKYGKIIDIVDPSVNQFNKFGKAFDDIVNSIRDGLNALLGPIAGFLAENPFATLLISAPLLNGIIKSMIPSFNGLGQTASDAFGGLAASLKDAERAANIELTSLKFLSGDAEAATEFVKMTNSELVELADVSETGFRGLKTLQQGGELAGKTIATNLKQAKLGLGAFADLPETVREEYVRMFEDLGTASKLSGNKLSSEMNIATSKASLAFVRFKQKAVVQLNKVALAAQRAAVKIASVFTRILTGIGIVSLLGDAGKALLEKIGINFDALSKSQQKYLGILESLNDENADFIKLQKELNKEFTTAAQVSQRVTGNIAELSRNIDFNEETRQIKALIEALGDDKFLNSASKAVGDLGTLLDEQLIRLRTLRDAIDGVGAAGATVEAKNAAAAYRDELDRVIKLLVQADDNAIDPSLLNGDLFDLTGLARAASAYEDLGLTVKALTKDLPEVEAKAQEAFRALAPDSTYAPLIVELEAIEAKYNKIAEDNKKAGRDIIAINERRKAQSLDALNLFREEQQRLIDAKNNTLKRGIFERKTFIIASRFQKQRIKSAMEELAIKDEQSVIEGNIASIIRGAALYQEGKLTPTQKETIRNLELEAELRQEQINQIKEQRKEMVRLNQAALDGAEQAVQKNIFDVLTGKEKDLKAFLVKIAEGTYNAIANEFSKILTESIFDIFSNKSEQTQEQKIKDLYLGENGVFRSGADIIADRIATKVEEAAAAAALKFKQYEDLPTGPTGAVGSPVIQRKANVGGSGKTILFPNQPKDDEEETGPMGGRSGRNAILQANTAAVQANTAAIQSLTTTLGGRPSTGIIGGRSGAASGGRNARNTQINADAADTQEQAGMLQTAGAQTMTNAVNTFAATVSSGRQMSAQGLGSTVLTSFISAFGTAAAGNFARYGGVMKDYSAGGIARGRNAGYPAMLHGTEAVVPLPNGNSIPVQMTGSGGGVNNVSVNVNMGEGTADVQGGEQGGVNLGKVIAGAVQEELQRQKRPGGILSPLGVA